MTGAHGARASTHPSAATARLQVSCSARHLAGLLPAPKAHSDRPGFGHLDRSDHADWLTSDRRSRAPRHRRGECQLEAHGRLIATAAQLTSLPSQQTVRRPTTCLSRSLPTRCASSCHTSTRGLVCLQGVVRDRNLRCGHVLRIGPASSAQLLASVAQELGDLMLAMRFARCCGPRYRPRWSISRLIWWTINGSFNVDSRAWAANVRRIYTPAALLHGWLVPS